MDDWHLLEAYAKNGSETAFAQLVKLHLDWVYSVALRYVGDPHLAEDVAQSVFVLLAHKARSLRPGTLLGGWLFRTTRLVAAHARRSEQRRKNRETTACSMIQETADSNEILWRHLAPHLDEAVAALSEADRSAILLRFYEKLPLRAAGERLGISEEAAKKRVSRALEKMRSFLDQRGVKLSAVALTALLADKTVQGASAALAGVVVKISIASASASASVALPHLVQATLRTWRWGKFNLAAGLAAGSLALVFLATTAGHFLGSHLEASTTLTPNVNVSQAPAENRQVAPKRLTETQAPHKTGALTGKVSDELERPIAGAKVWGGFGEQPFAQDITDESGQFALDRVAAPTYVTVTADGYAADQREFERTNVPAPLVFHLNPILPLIVRFVDESGQGVAGVKLFLADWWGWPGTLGQHLSQQSEANGQLQWLSPPKGELELQFAKAGYRFSRANKLVADGIEHLITLHPVATVTGSVTDAENGLPIANFELTVGHSQTWNPANPLPVWELRSQAASNGFYSAVIEEEQVPFFRIEADGYETVESEIQLTNGIVDVRDFQLQRKSAAHSISGTVLMPDGSPAVGIEVALCTAQVGVMLNGTAFEPEAFGNMMRGKGADYRRRTDDHGAFSFDPKPGAHTVFAVGPAGLGKVRCFDFSKPLEIRLERWGRIEGTVSTLDGQWAGRKVQWRPNGTLTRWMTLFYALKGFSTVSDSSGRFTLEHIPPGDSRVAIDNGSGTASTLSKVIHVNPGETAQTQIGGVGRRVTGRLVAPPDVEIRDWSTQTRIHVTGGDSYSMPTELTGTAAEQWQLEFEDTEAGQAWFRTQCTYEFAVGADGSFTIPEVLPGKYRLLVSVMEGSLGSGPSLTHRSPRLDSRIAFGGTELEVADAPQANGAALNLGDIVLTVPQ